MVGLGLFAPLPLAIMVPFMAGQSFAMGEAFGKGFQYGKRRVSSMTNEEFNSSSAEAMFNETTADITKMIPSMKNAMSQFSTLQTDIILEMIKYIGQLPKDVVSGLAGTGSDVVQDIVQGIPALGGVQGFALNTLLNNFGANLSSPAGVNALLSWWKTLTSNDKNIVKSSGSSVWSILNFALNAGVGPSPPSGGITPPQADNTIVVNADGTLTNKDTRGRNLEQAFDIMPAGRFPYIGRKAGLSQMREFKKLILEIKNLHKNWLGVSSAVKPVLMKRIRPLKQALADLIRRYGITDRLI